MNLLNKAGTIMNKIFSGLWFFSGVIFLFILFSVIVSVILRYVFSISFLWVIEIDETLQLVITFLGASWCLKVGGHVRIDIILSMLKERAQLFINTINYALIAIMCLVFAYYAGVNTWESFQRGTSTYKVLRTPKYIFTSVMCLGALLIIIESAKLSYKHFKMWRTFKNKK